MSRDIFGQTNICENCGRTIRGSGWKYCAYCRNSRVRNPWGGRSSRPLTPEEREMRRQMSKALGYVFIGLFIALAVAFLIWGIYTLISTVWNSGVLGRMILLSPILIVILFFVHKIWNNSKPYENEKDKIRRFAVLGILFLMGIGITFFLNWTPNLPTPLGNSSAQVIPQLNETCQYKEQVDTGQMISVLYDTQGNKYTNPIEFVNFATGNAENIGGPCLCKTSFGVKNNIDKEISVTLNYQTTIGSNSHDKTQSLTLEPLSTKTINEELGDMCWASCSVPKTSISYTFESTSETIPKTEKVINEICKQCNGVNCLNDSLSCKEDSQCGSGICNTIGICSTEKGVECPQGMKKQGDVCKDSSLTSFKRNYLNTVGIVLTILIASYLIYILLRKSSVNKK